MKIACSIECVVKKAGHELRNHYVSHAVMYSLTLYALATNTAAPVFTPDPVDGI